MVAALGTGVGNGVAVGWETGAGVAVGWNVAVGDGLGANVGAGMGVAAGVGGKVGTGVTVIVFSTRVQAANNGPSTAAERPRAVAPFIN